MAYLEQQTLTILDVENETGEASTLAAVRGDAPLVLDFWHTRCVKCPEAITRLDAKAAQHPGVTFAACALSLGSEDEGTQEQVLELLQDQWENMKHLYMTVEEKELAKKQFGFKAVPFCVVFGADGSVLFQGDPSAVDLSTVFDAEQAASKLEAISLGGSPTSVLNPDGGDEAPSKPSVEAGGLPGGGGACQGLPGQRRGPVCGRR